MLQLYYGTKNVRKSALTTNTWKFYIAYTFVLL
jgi:hypothetical protein